MRLVQLCEVGRIDESCDEEMRGVKVVGPTNEFSQLPNANESPRASRGKLAHILAAFDEGDYIYSLQDS